MGGADDAGVQLEVGRWKKGGDGKGKGRRPDDFSNWEFGPCCGIWDAYVFPDTQTNRKPATTTQPLTLSSIAKIFPLPQVLNPIQPSFELHATSVKANTII